MSHHRILLISGAEKEVRRIAHTLRAMGTELEAKPTLAAAGDLTACDLLVTNYDALSPADRARLLELTGGPRLLLLSGGECARDLSRLLGSQVLTNLVARNEEVDPGDLIVTVQKLLRGDIFGIEKYFTWGVEPRRIQLRSSNEKRDAIQTAEEYAAAIGVRSRLVTLLSTVVDELVTNAIFNGAVDKDGKSRYGHLERTREVVLEEHESVELKLICDGRRLGISVTDTFGSLTRERLQEYLARCLRKGSDQLDDKPGGAGLGLYCVFESLSHFVVNISPGKRTEMIGLIDVWGTYRDFATRHKSFNVFMGA
jgi:hypothetical protein